MSVTLLGYGYILLTIVLNLPDGTQYTSTCTTYITEAYSDKSVYMTVTGRWVGYISGSSVPLSGAWLQVTATSKSIYGVVTNISMTFNHNNYFRVMRIP